MRKQILFILILVVSLSAAAQTTAMERRYRSLAERFESRDKQLQGDLKAYLKNYPYTTYADEVKYMQGVLWAEQGEYKQALEILEQVDTNALGQSHKRDYIFYCGYSHMMLQEYERAAVYMLRLTESNNRYTTRATYYYAYCMYQLEQYDKALPALEQLEQEPAYARSVPYYITQIYFTRGNSEEAERRAIHLLRTQPDSEHAGELHRMIGEIRYQQGDYVGASEQLALYEEWANEHQQELRREDMYLLGHAEYKLRHYADAVRHLKLVKQLPDTLSESACLTIGHSLIHMNQPEQAMIWYQAAANYRLTPSITEEATYNYTLCSYRSSSALGESVRAFNDFLRTFPHSKYESNIYSLLTNVLMESKNYAAAVNALDSIAHPTPKMLETKQYLRYQLAADAFMQGKMQETANWASEVLTHRKESDRYTTEALYLRAEAAYRLNDFAASEKDVQAFFARHDAKQSANYVAARYLEGYCAFAQNHFSQARTAFAAYIDDADANEPTYADALNRIGDCYFNARDFKQAVAYYSQAGNLQTIGADYAYFQRGYALGLLRRYQDKITALQSLVSMYPKSDYADDGVYETARAQLQLNDERGAIETYGQLLENYPHSALARKASLERAMLYRDLRQTNEAIAAYRKTIEHYPATEEAYSALEGLQALYVEQGRVEEYLAYTKTLARLNMTITTKEDSLLFASAEMQYMQSAYAKAVEGLNNYINQYCAGGRYCTTARYYLADSYYRLGKTEKALEQYKQLAELAANPYQEEAATRMAEIYFDRKEYAAALEAFYHMNSLASSRENSRVAQLGILRCSALLQRHKATIDAAGRLLGDNPDEEVRNEALYCRAKAYVAQGEWEQAQPDLKALSAEVRTAQGAEAKYLLAQSMYELGQTDEAEEEVMSFTRMSTSQQYWLARALILLSDIYTRRGETFQARQYLLALQQNYTLTGDDIPTLIAQRITAINAIEQSATNAEKEKEVQ